MQQRVSMQVIERKMEDIPRPYGDESPCPLSEFSSEIESSPGPHEKCLFTCAWAS